MSLRFYKIYFTIALLSTAVVVLVASCKKDTRETETNPSTPPVGENYTSMQDFFARNSIPTQTFTFDSKAGYSVTTSSGTQITVPVNAFDSLSGGHISGNV